MWSPYPERRDSTCSDLLLCSKSIWQWYRQILRHLKSLRSLVAVLRHYNRSFRIFNAVESSAVLSKSGKKFSSKVKGKEK